MVQFLMATSQRVRGLDDGSLNKPLKLNTISGANLKQDHLKFILVNYDHIFALLPYMLPYFHNPGIFVISKPDSSTPTAGLELCGHRLFGPKQPEPSLERMTPSLGRRPATD